MGVFLYKYIFAFVQFQVSNGAECVLIKKSWFLKHANEATLRKLRNQVISPGRFFYLCSHTMFIPRITARMRQHCTPVNRLSDTFAL